MERIVDLLMFPLSPAELPGTEGCVAINYSATNGLSGIAFSKKIIVLSPCFERVSAEGQCPRGGGEGRGLR